MNIIDPSSNWVPLHCGFCIRVKFDNKAFHPHELKEECCWMKCLQFFSFWSISANKKIIKPAKGPLDEQTNRREDSMQVKSFKRKLLRMLIFHKHPFLSVRERYYIIILENNILEEVSCLGASPQLPVPLSISADVPRSETIFLFLTENQNNII